MLINGYKPGSNITVLNTTYQYPKRTEDGKYTDDVMTVLYKDLDTGEKKIEEILNPEYRFFESKDDVYIDHNLLFIDKNDVVEKRVPYKELLKHIAIDTGNEEFFYSNIKNKDRRANEDLHMIPTIFNSDMHIEDAYRFYFDLEYKNESFQITKAYLDIETDNRYMMGDFPELGECPINAISYVDVNTDTISVFLLRDHGNQQVIDFEESIKDGLFDELKDFIINHANKLNKNNSKRYKLDRFKFEFYFYDEEINMLKDLFLLINMKEPDFVLAWNMSFDIPYIIERIIRLGYDPAEIMCHPIVQHKQAKYYIDVKNSQLPAQRGDFFTIIGKTVYLDQLVHFASRRKGQSAFDNLKLDYIGNKIAEIGKLDWSGLAKSFADFSTNHYKLFVFYNIMDTLVQYCIEEKVNDIGYIFNKCLINNTRYHKGHRQMIYLTNRGIKEFRKDGFIMGNNANRKNEKPPKFPGALVGDPLNNTDYSKVKINGEPVNIANNLDDFDYKSLYPSTMREFNIAPNTQIGKIEIDHEVHDGENPFNYDKYCRGGQFLQDYYSENYIEFCSRWLHLGTFSDVLDDMDEFYKMHIPNGTRGLNYTKPFIIHEEQSIPQYGSFIIWDKEVYDTCNNNFITRYPEKRDFSKEYEYLRNHAQMDIDDIDKILRRKQRQIQEDSDLKELFESAAGTQKAKNEEEEESDD